MNSKLAFATPLKPVQKKSTQTGLTNTSSAYQTPDTSSETANEVFVFNVFSTDCELTRDIPGDHFKGTNPCMNNSTFVATANF